jgi:hypothetical protein
MSTRSGQKGPVRRVWRHRQVPPLFVSEHSPVDYEQPRVGRGTRGDRLQRHNFMAYGGCSRFSGDSDANPSPGGRGISLVDRRQIIAARSCSTEMPWID